MQRNAGDPRKLRVLLVGNSYTKFNLLHMLIERLAEASGGPKVQVEVEARSGYSLRLHWKQRSALSKIKSGRFTHVVLQGHSLSAVDHPDELAEDAERFSAAIAATGARTVLFETWARKPGTSLYRKHDSVHTFDEMVSLIDTAYSGAAKRLHVGLAPVGGAFERAFRSNPSVPLWGSDGSHPTLAGSYMAACVLYGAITGLDPRHATWEPFGLSAELAHNIRSVASATLAQEPSSPARHSHLPAQAVAAVSGERTGASVGSASRSAAKPGRSRPGGGVDRRDDGARARSGRCAEHRARARVRGAADGSGAGGGRPRLGRSGAVAARSRRAAGTGEGFARGRRGRPRRDRRSRTVADVLSRPPIDQTDSCGPAVNRTPTSEVPGEPTTLERGEHGMVDPHKETSSDVVLLVDDNESDRRAMAGLLTAAGFSVRESPSPFGATRAAREAGASVVVLELSLPVLNGGKLAALLRENPNLQHLKLVLVSNYDEAMVSAYVRREGRDAFVHKDRLQADFVKTIRELLAS